MMRSNKRSAPWGTMVALVVLIALVIYQRLQPEENNSAVKDTHQEVSYRPISPTSQELSASPKKVEDYDVFENCKLLENRGNDGDSFHVSIRSRGDQEIRLYYVDAPESHRHQYNGDRIIEQAEYFNSSEDAVVGLGVEAKEFVHNLLRNAPFVVLTKWEKVFESGRFYGFVQVDYQGKRRWLHELLVEKGYARIYTKGEKVPGGDYPKARINALKNLEIKAKTAGVGGWAR